MKNIYFSGDLYQNGTVFSGGGGVAGTDGQFIYNNGGTSAGSDKLVYRATGPTGPTGGPTGPAGLPTIQLDAYLVPTTNATYDLGDPGIQFTDVPFSGNLYNNGLPFSVGGLTYLPTGPTGPGGGPTGPAGPTLELGAHIVPNADVSYDLGATGLRFRDLYMSGSTIYLGDSVALKSVDNGLSIANSLGNVDLISVQIDPLSIGGNYSGGAVEHPDIRGISVSSDGVFMTSISAIPASPATPAIYISNNGGDNFSSVSTYMDTPITATFGGSISGTTLTVDSITGSIAVGSLVSGAGVTLGTTITAFITGGGQTCT